jgi:hypothetical protein
MVIIIITQQQELNSLAGSTSPIMLKYSTIQLYACMDLIPFGMAAAATCARLNRKPNLFAVSCIASNVALSILVLSLYAGSLDTTRRLISYSRLLDT